MVNKADLVDEWKVNSRQIRQLFPTAGNVIKTSAKTGDNVAEAFGKLAESIFDFAYEQSS